jgi:hypothetical protein
LIFAFVLHETSYESFNAHHDRVYKIMRGEEPATFPGPVADLIRSLPGVEEVSRQTGISRPLISGDRLQVFQEVPAAGSHFFDLLQIPFVRGDRASALGGAGRA